MAAPQKPFGFTLIELMITIAVLVVLVTLTAPAFNLAEQRRVIGAAESALDQIQMARTEAIKQGQNIFFVSKVDGDSWCHAISDTAGCDCMVADSCTIVMAGGEAPVERTRTHDGFRGVTMTGDQEIEFDNVRGALLNPNDRQNLSFTSDSFGMEVQINPIGRPRACGTNRAMGAYSEC
ncbi:GspH/FimT family pseudopilin [Thioalkalivibrio sp. AKL19]|uniref:GspH/FimT family pseudopilin n=1 Tax=Thioalkalivibrio sp. AKL19 TaxID=1266914 RepID=UPI00040EB0A5|nr:GspH/FimT family pseudopilin [Thioalkalivibrio sp. AKL19]